MYDLARRVWIAERWSARDAILFGTPAAEPHLADGFYREAGGSGGDPFVWARSEAELSLTWPAVAARGAVLDVAPYRGARGQSVEVLLNGARVAGFALNDTRHRYALPLPAEAQRAGENRLRFVFARAASPADEDPGSLDRRQLAAAFYGLVVAPRGDAGLDDFLGRDAPRPFSVVDEGGAPALVQAGPSVVRYALRLPERAELRFTPALHPAARASAGAASFRVMLESAERPGQERELFARTVGARDAAAGETAVPLPGAPGEIVRVGLHVSGAPSDRFAWGVWRAPRILGRGAVEDPRATFTPQDSARAAPLRKALEGASVVFVILDAARARELGCYGYGRPTTPELDRIAAEGVLFERAFTPAVYTLGAMPSIWTSQHPDRHHSEVSFAARLPKDRLTLAELLSGRGIATSGFVANAVAGAAFGFDRGFSEFRELVPELGSSAADGFARLLPGWVQAHAERRFFLYLHFREPHFPYDPPPPFDTRFGAEGPISKPARSQTDWITDLNQGRRRPAPGEIEHLVRLYDGNLAFADQQLGVVRRILEAAGLWERSVVIVAADHGEGLFDHGWIGHNVYVFEEAMRVPLIVRLPRGTGPAGLRVAGLVDLLDVAPTVADVFGVLGQGGSDREFQGRSLLPAIAGAPGKPLVLSRTVWDRPRYALRDGRYKLVYYTLNGEQQLYDLEADPGETRSVADREPLRAAYFRETLHDWIARLQSRRATAEEAKVTPEQCENMRALGYVNTACQ